MNSKEKCTLKELGMKNNNQIEVNFKLKGGAQNLDQLIEQNDPIYLNFRLNNEMMNSSKFCLIDPLNKQYYSYLKETTNLTPMQMVWAL